VLDSFRLQEVRDASRSDRTGAPPPQQQKATESSFGAQRAANCISLSRRLRKVDVDGLPFAEVQATADAADSSSSSTNRLKEGAETATATTEASPGVGDDGIGDGLQRPAARHPYDDFLKSLANEDQTKALRYYVDLEREKSPPSYLFFPFSRLPFARQRASRPP
jgi:hypothetical protein